MNDKKTIYKYDLNKLKPLLKNYLIDFHNLDLRNRFRCLNPEHTDNNPSMGYSDKYNICHCFACGKTYDIFSLVAQDYNISSTNFKAQINKVVELFPNIVEAEKKYTDQFKKYSKPEKLTDYSQFYKKCQIDSQKSDYLQKRGIPKRLEYKYGIGYDSFHDMVIFPINNNCYFSRSCNSNLKINSQGTIHLWNEKVFNSPTSSIIITESIIDALSLETQGCVIPCVSLNGVSNYNKLIDLLVDNKYNGILILALDNDNAGKNYTEIIKKEIQSDSRLSKVKVLKFPTTITKDLNEELIKYPNNLSKLVKIIEEEVSKVMKDSEYSKLRYNDFVAELTPSEIKQLEKNTDDYEL